MTSSRPPKAPKHLKPPTRRWVDDVADNFDLEPHHVRLLTLAGEAWDRAVAAREAIAKHGITYQDRFGAPRVRPEVADLDRLRLGPSFSCWHILKLSL